MFFLFATNNGRLYSTHRYSYSSSTTGHSKRSPPPTYDGICAEKYIEWELAIDNIFSQCCICEWRKIQNATSILTDSASVWWDKLYQSDKPRTWKMT